MGFALLIFGSCNITKRVENNQLLLVKNDIKVLGPLNKDIKDELPNYYKQRHNEKFLGIIKLKLYFFNLGSGGKDRWYKRFFRNKLGEPPILIDTVFIESTVRSMNGYLRTKGHYYSDIQFEVKPRKLNKKKGKVTYLVTPGNYYRFYNYELNIADKELYDLIKPTMNDAFIVNGRRFDQANILKEQERIVELMRNNGYYFFTKEFVDFDVDTSRGDWKAYVAMNVKNRTDYEPHKKYIINDITIDIDKNTDGTPFSVKDTVPFPAFNYIPHQYKLNPEILGRNLFFYRGDLFRQKNLTRSYGRLSDLSIFKFINVSTKINDTGEVGRIDYTFKILPSIKYDYTLEPQAITSDQNRTLTTKSRSYGLAATLQFNNRNVFKNAEILQLSYRSSFEAQGKVNGSKLFNATEQSFTASIIMPRVLFLPWLDHNINIINSKSTISASAIYELNVDYERRVATTGLTYQFNKKLITFYVSPVEFSFIKTDLKSSTLVERAKTDIFLQNLFSNNVIMDSRIGFSYSNKNIAKGLSFFFLRWDALEFAGNTLTFMNQVLNQERSSSGRFRIFDVNYFQYVKSAFDFRYNTIYDKNNSTVFRVFSGIVIPYGNSPTYTPFEKRFFVGGANSLRAWSPRSIGPGSYVADNQIDHSGDIKIELNAEYRFNMYNHWLEGAWFTDIGNIWGTQKDATKPGADFQLSRFYKELAADVGFGIRLNFTIVLIRFDLGLPVHDPTYTNLDDRWVIKDFNGKWMFDNLYFNFGIGYPF
jgi:hypothetical protein